MFSSDMINVTFVTITAYTYLATVPGYEAGIDYVSRTTKKDINYQYVAVYNKELLRHCAVMVEYDAYLASEYYYKNRNSRNTATVFTGTFCGASEIVLFSPLAREWNVLAISIGGTDPALSDKTNFPTNLSFAAIHHTAIIITVTRLFKLHNWKTLFILCDTNAVQTFLVTVCKHLRATFVAPTYQVNTATFDSAKGLTNFEPFLSLISRSARVTFIVTSSVTTRHFMVTAAKNNYAGNDYVYIHIQMTSSQPPGIMDILWARNESDDTVARAAFSSLLVIEFDSRWTSRFPKSQSDPIKSLSQTKYNITYGVSEKLSAATMTAFETILIVSQIVEEMIEADEPPSVIYDGRILSKRFWNRTFHLRTGDLFIDQHGDRLPGVLVRQFNDTTASFEAAITYQAAEPRLICARPQCLEWPTGKPPLDEPICGFDGQRENCLSRRVTFQTGLIMGVCITVVIILLMCTVICMVRQKRIAMGDIDSDWWTINSDLVIYLGYKSSYATSGLNYYNRVVPRLMGKGTWGYR